MDYRGFEIDTTTYGMVSVFFEGDDVMFDTVDEAKAFIDEVA